MPLSPDPLPDLQVIRNHRSRVGESPVWDGHAGVIRWCDIDGQRLLSATLTGDILSDEPFDGPVGAIAMAGPGRVIMAIGNRVVLYDLAAARQTIIAEVPLAIGERLNDGKVGPDGTFWIGAINSQEVAARKSGLYRVTADGRVEQKLRGLGISNGLAFSPDSRRMYHADTFTGEIVTYTFDPETGNLGEKTPFAWLTRTDGLPDGGICDRAGNYWSAGVTANCLNCISPAGRLMRTVPLPVEAPTSVCFAGPDLDQMVVTSLKRPQTSDPRDGQTMVLAPGVGGLPAYEFQLS